MEYTKNHRLPQWKKTDRIMMEDFNQMCADIESGLDGVQAAVGQAGSAAAAALEAAKAQGAQRLQKLGYDLCQVNGKLLSGGAVVGRTKCLAYNGLATGEEQSRTSGFRFVPDRHGAQLGPQTALDLAQLTSEMAGCVTVPSVSDNGEASQVVTFRCPQPGTITQLVVWLRNENYLVAPYAALECLDLGDGRQVYAQRSIKLKIQMQVYDKQPLDVSIPLEAGHNYQLKIRTTTPSFIGSIGFGEETKPAITGAVSTQQLSSGTVRESLTLDSPAQMALAVLHYTGGDAAPVVSVNGKNMTARTVQQGTGIRGESCTEREYYLSGSWSGTVPLTVSCESPSKDLIVYDVAFCLI